jgi:penicillin amidase
MTAVARATSRVRLLLRVLAAFAGVLLLLVAVAGAYVRLQLGRSLAQLDGEHRLPGLSAQVIVERDSIGVPTIAGTSRIDVARAIGFVHAQERFFQMDLLRRRAAGELAEVFGRVALATDRASRLHRFRARARGVVEGAHPDDRALLEAYAQGVNAGLGALRAAPPEYLLLRVAPRPWQAEDSVLVVAAMFFDLQDSGGVREARAALLHEALPAPVAAFLLSSASDWDTPLDGPALPPPAVPGVEVFDFRAVTVPRAADRRPSSPAAETDVAASAFAASLGLTIDREAFVFGSNNWAVAGTRTADGRAILANDMHLGINVPNIWYRASLAWAESEGPHRVTGVTLPGVPTVTVGSNGAVAWGFTNTTADWTDRVLIELVPGEPSRYLTPAGPRPFDTIQERIRVKGGDDEMLEVRETIWGPVTRPDHRGRVFALRWVAHDPEALNIRLRGLECVRTVEEAFDVGHRAGVPAQNLVVADASGHIGWSVAGRIPRRVGFDGTLPVSWADGSRGWSGWYEPSEYPRVVNPPDGQIVTANNRIAGPPALAMLGDGGYDPGARARQIRDGLQALAKPTEHDMLAVHLDDRALFLERWRQLLLQTLTDAAVGGSDGRREYRRLVGEAWTGRASVDSVAYRLVRQFRGKVTELAMAPFVARVRALDPEYPATTRATEGVAWALVSERPPHLLDPKYVDWHALLLDAVDQSLAALTEGDHRLSQRTWGDANTSLVQHPLSRGVPWLAWWLDMPKHALPGDSHMPRVQGPTFGASERLAVSPGHEAEGYFHMPGGQSGHPLSPHYRDGHSAWVRGEATRFLPGPTVSRLELRPQVER